MGSLMGLMAMMAGGGEVQHYVDGGDVQPDQQNSSQPQSRFGKFLKGTTQQSKVPNAPAMNYGNPGANALYQGVSSFGKGVGSMLTAPNAMSTTQGPTMAGGPGDAGGPAASNTLMSANGGDVGSKLKKGGHVPGKPTVGGAKNDYANDTVKALLSPGEIVIPRSVTQSADPVNGAARFVQTVIARRKNKGK